MMDAERAERTAREFVATKQTPSLRHIFSRVRPSPWVEGEWLALFGLEAAEGGPVDGWAVVVVDASGQARFLVDG